MRRHIAAWCIVTLGVGALAACAQPAGSVDAGSSAPASSSAPVSPTVSPEPPAPSAPPSQSSPPIVVSPPGPVESSGAQTTLSGQIFAGAEPSCLLLRHGSVQYLLLNASTMKLRAGMRAVVTGHVVRGIMTHCQQGQPFQITNADPLAPTG